MGKQLTTYNLFDGALDELAKNHGGWPKLLDPTQATPDAFLLELEKNGYSEYTFESIKKQIGKPERQYWIAMIASIVKNMRKANDHEANSEMLDEFLPKMREHGITDDEIKRALAGP